MMMSQMMGFLGTLFALPVTLLRYLLQWLHFRRLANRFPGPRPLPLVGNIFDIGVRLPDTEFLRYVTEQVSKYKTCQIWLGPIRIMCINEPKDIQCFFQNRNNQAKPRMFYKVAGDILGDGIATQNGDRWHRLHKIIAPAYRQEIINTFVTNFNKESDIFIQLLDQRANGTAIDIKPMIERFAIDCIYRTLLGLPSNEQTEDSGIVALMEEGQEAIGYRLIRPWLYPSFVFYYFSSWGRKMLRANDEMQKLTKKIIGERVKLLNEELPTDNTESDSLQKGKKQLTRFLDILLHNEERNHITHKELVEDLQTNILAGVDATFLTVGFSLYMLAKHPEVQQKVVSELQSVFAEESLERPEVTPALLRRMEYLEMVLKETLRMYSPFWCVLREAGVDTPLKSCDLVIPAGAIVFISQRSLHMDPELYPEPEVFDPERFSPENSADRHSFAFLPFAAGERTCIGRKFSMAEMKTLVSKIIWNYEVRPDSTYKPDLRWAITAFPINGMWLRFIKRW